MTNKLSNTELSERIDRYLNNLEQDLALIRAGLRKDDKSQLWLYLWLLSRHATRLTECVVIRERRSGTPWAFIGSKLQISKQAAWEKYRDSDAE